MITIIAALTKNRVVGVNGTLPWNIPEDLKNFKSITSGNVVLMGRKTYESIPAKFRPLPNRHNIIISRSLNSIHGVDVCSSIEEGIEKGKQYGKEICIIGGGSIYEQTIPLADKMVLSFIKEEFEGDTYFPNFNKDEWSIQEEKEFDTFTLVTFTR